MAAVQRLLTGRSSQFSDTGGAPESLEQARAVGATFSGGNVYWDDARRIIVGAASGETDQDFLQIYSDKTGSLQVIDSTKDGAGTVRPLSIQMGGVERVLIGAGGGITLSGTTILGTDDVSDLNIKTNGNIHWLFKDSGQTFEPFVDGVGSIGRPTAVWNSVYSQRADVRLAGAAFSGILITDAAISLGDGASPQDLFISRKSDGELQVQTPSGTYTLTPPSGGSSPLTTKGDLYTFSTVDDRLPVSPIDGYFLSSDSGEATGLKWIPSPSGTIGGLTPQTIPKAATSSTLDDSYLQQVTHTLSMVDSFNGHVILEAKNLNAGSGSISLVEATSDTSGCYIGHVSAAWSDGTIPGNYGVLATESTSDGIIILPKFGAGPLKLKGSTLELAFANVTLNPSTGDFTVKDGSSIINSNNYSAYTSGPVTFECATGTGTFVFRNNTPTTFVTIGAGGSGITVNSGSVIVSAGDVNVVDGAHYVNSNNFSPYSGSTMNFAGIISGNSAWSTTGNITSSAGNIVASAGDITVNNASHYVNSNNFSVLTGGATMAFACAGGKFTYDGLIEPTANNTYALGSSGKKFTTLWSVALNTGDLNMDNDAMDSHLTLREAVYSDENPDELYLVNRRTGRKYTVMLKAA